jgi:hypothetical protein
MQKAGALSAELRRVSEPRLYVVFNDPQRRLFRAHDRLVPRLFASRAVIQLPLGLG